MNGWKCKDWIKIYNKADWFCNSVCPFGRNDFGISCKIDKKELLKKVV